LAQSVTLAQELKKQAADALAKAGDSASARQALADADANLALLKSLSAQLGGVDTVANVAFGRRNTAIKAAIKILDNPSAPTSSKDRALVSLDANLRLKLWPLARARACLQQAVSMCDLFLPSLEDVQPLCGQDDPQAIIDWSHQLGAASVVLKRGALGATVSEGGTQRHVPGHAVNCVDATGAGDCFAGNLLARLAQGDDLDQGVRYANAAAALAVQGFGAVAPLPRPDQVRALLG
jgi:hypothetical protein